MKLFMIVMIGSFLLMSHTVHAKRFILDVQSTHQMMKHLQLLQVVSSSDTVVLEVKSQPSYSKAMICRYVDALKSTKARVRLGDIPREVLRYARGC